MNRPSKKMYGLLHSTDGSPIIREPRAIKTGIGLLKGKEIHVYIDLSGKWVVQVGKDIKRFATKLEARKYYRAEKPNAPERKYPSRLPYFTFSRMAPDGNFEPDWEIIESHGPIPTEIDIVFLRDEPFEASYQLWTAAEKKCDGDGINALRVLSMANTPAEKSLATEAQQNGERFFPVANGCWTRNCPFAQSQGDKPSLCRPHGILRFQLLKDPVLGGTAEFVTSGHRSISQIFSCLEIFRRVAGRGRPEQGHIAGVPLKMVLRPYKTSFNGRSTTQYGVSLELRASTALELKQKLITAGVEFQNAAELPGTVVDIEPETTVTAAAIAAEFDPAVAEVPENQVQLEESDDFGDGPIGALAHAWDEDGVKDEQAGTAATDGSGAHTPRSAGSNPAPAPAARASVASVERFYGLCRARGMTDKVIREELGRSGFESKEEITESSMSGLMQWAEQWKPGQGSLL